jgi:hypothetical protein
MGGEFREVPMRNFAGIMQMFVERGAWPFPTPRPGEPGCKVPRSFLPPRFQGQQRIEHAGIFGKEAADALIDQEYYCSFEAAILGAYWGKEMLLAEQQGRITDVPVNTDLPVQTAWDIGVDDAMAIWCFQVYPDHLDIVDYYEGHGQGFALPAQESVGRITKNDSAATSRSTAWSRGNRGCVSACRMAVLSARFQFCTRWKRLSASEVGCRQERSPHIGCLIEPPSMPKPRALHPLASLRMTSL